MGKNGVYAQPLPRQSGKQHSPILLLGFVAGLVVGLTAWKRQKPQNGSLKRIGGSGGTTQTALITGASSGIGAAFAHRLAAEGFNLMLVARREDRLHALATELMQQYGRQVDVFISDLSIPGEVALLERRIAACDTLSILVNNAGFGTTGLFADVDISKQLDMIHVHINATVHLTHAALPGMIARRCGAIINVSSIAAFARSAGMVTYSASKNYLNTFSEALSLELRGSGVQVQALCPGFTATEFHDTPEFATFDRANVPSYLWMSPEEVVQVSLTALDSDEVVVVPGFENRLIILFMHLPILGRVWRKVRQRWRTTTPQPLPAR